MPTPDIRLRPVGEADLAFVRDVYASTRQAELDLTGWPPQQRAAFVDMQFNAQLADYTRRWPESRHDLILVDGHPAGRLWVDRSPTHIHVLDVTVLPEWRNHGVATALLRGLIDEARGSGRSFDLHVERGNRAIRLYERLGLTVLDSDGPIYLRMGIGRS